MGIKKANPTILGSEELNGLQNPCHHRVLMVRRNQKGYITITRFLQNGSQVQHSAVWKG